MENHNQKWIFKGDDYFKLELIVTLNLYFLSGHNIRGLRCSFKLLYPSLQIYLLSESCDDLFYPNPSLPVVTQCGMVVLLFDHESW